MANAKIPRLVNGVCVCSICCHVVWTTTYTCTGTPGWSAPAIVSSEIVAGESPGPCASDVPWYQPGSDACVRHWDAYYPIADLCGSCDDVTKTPPPDMIGVPTGCCGGTCCRTVWRSTWICHNGPWSAPVISTASVPGVACTVDSGWVDSGCASFYTRYTTPGDCTSGVTPPPAHPAIAPSCCCPQEPCVNCGAGFGFSSVPNPQPSALIFGAVGGCAGFNGIYTPTTYAAAPFLSGFFCFWNWTGPGGPLTLRYETIGGSWTVIFGGTSSPVFVNCICGTITGTIGALCTFGFPPTSYFIKFG